MVLKLKIPEIMNPIFGRRSPRVERVPKKDNAQEGSASANQATINGTHPSKPSLLTQGNGKDIQVTRAKNAVRGNNFMAKERMDWGSPISERDVGNVEIVEDAITSVKAATLNNPEADQIINDAEDSHVLPTNSRMASSTAMFGGNVRILGGTFVQNNRSEKKSGFELLQERVATAAFHNSVQRVDPPRCHPDTRVTILENIYHWINQSESREKWLFWLNGAAGAGKSAIVQTIAERCVQAAIAIASFFFFRADSSRNTMASLPATLAYQLIQVIPDTRRDILSTIERNPLIFEQSLESQLQQLLVQPLLRLPQHLRQLFVILIDGLDECNNRKQQSSLIKSFASVSRGKECPIVFFCASRREPQIEATFQLDQVSDLLRTLPLDNSDIEHTSNDIRHFLTDKFTEIKKTHLRRHLLPTDWPPTKVIKEIISTSSGQFIYASVVVNYVASPRANPAHQLDVVRGIRLRDPSSQNPFAHLDALYQHIFSQVEALDKVLDILAYILITEIRRFYHLERVFLLDDGALEVYFADLTSVIKCEPNATEIKFLHASLPDFLRDKSRSERYHIDVDEYKIKLLCMLLERVPGRLDPLSPTDISDLVERQEASRISAIKYLLASGVKVLDRLALQTSFMNFNFAFYKINDLISPAKLAASILTDLKQLDFGDQYRAYHHVLEIFAVELAKNWQSIGGEDKSLVKKTPDLDARIRRILKGKGWLDAFKRLRLRQSEVISLSK